MYELKLKEEKVVVSLSLTELSLILKCIEAELVVQELDEAPVDIELAQLRYVIKTILR